MPVFDPEGMIRIHNDSDEVVTLTYSSKPFRIAPNKDGFVPYCLVAYYMGDVRSGMDKIRIPIGPDKVSYIPSREDEIKRLSVKYGVYNENDTDGIRNRMPKISAYSLEDSEKFVFPCDDPHCLQGTQFDDREGDEFLQEQVHSLSQQLLIMQQMLENKKQTNVQGFDSIPIDNTKAQAAKVDVRVNLSEGDDDISEDLPNVLIPGGRSE